MTFSALVLALVLQAPAADASTAAERAEPPSAPAAQSHDAATEPSEVGEAEGESSGPSPTVHAEYQVGPGDGLEVTVIDNADLSRIPTVQTNGAIVLPLLGEVQVAGLTEGEIQRKITSLLEKDYLVNPQVVVKVKQFNSQFVGAVVGR